MQQGLSPQGESRALALAVASLVWLAAFALLFTLGWAVGAWPQPAEGRFGGLDLPAGLAFGVVLGANLWLSPFRHPKMSSGWPAAHGGAS